MQRNYNGARMTRAIAIMHALRGMFDRPNAGIIYDNVRSITGMNNFDGRGNYFLTGKEQHVNMTDLDQALKAKNPTSQNLIDNHTTPPQPIKPIHLFFFYNGNPVAVSPNVNQVIENLKRDDLYVVGFDMIMTDSMEYCDLVLPASTQFETDDIIGDYHGWFVQICEKVIEPVGESIPNWDFFAEWGRRMGFKEQAFKDTSFDIMRQLLNTKAPWYKDVTLERLQKEKWIKLPYPSSVPVRSGGKCGTESGKIELYSEMMNTVGKEIELSANHIGFVTMLDVARDPRWGRTEETDERIAYVCRASVRRSGAHGRNDRAQGRDLREPGRALRGLRCGRHG